MRKDGQRINPIMKKEANKYNRPGSNERTNFLVPEIENYACGNCGETIAGGRYNNHCPHCLWSKHLDDKVPGDRASQCQSLMKPVGVIQKSGTWRIVHQCLGCKKNTVIDSIPEDNIDLIIELSQSPLSAISLRHGGNG